MKPMHGKRAIHWPHQVKESKQFKPGWLDGLVKCACRVAILRYFWLRIIYNHPIGVTQTHPKIQVVFQHRLALARPVKSGQMS